jgi:hypothetical protein
MLPNALYDGIFPSPRQQSACHLVGYYAAMVGSEFAVAVDLLREQAFWQAVELTEKNWLRFAKTTTTDCSLA